MTAPDRPSAADGEQPRSRSESEVVRQQIAAIEDFNDRVRRAQEAAVAASQRSREMRLDSARRMDVLRRQQRAVVARAQEQLELTGGLLRARAGRRAVLAHRHEWFLDRVSASLLGLGVEVVARVDNGADAVGLTLCEQPDLALVQDALAMLPGEQVVRELRELCPSTRVVAQCAYGDRVAALLHAGAAAVYTRRAAPADVAAGMHALLRA